MPKNEMFRHLQTSFSRQPFCMPAHSGLTTDKGYSKVHFLYKTYSVTNYSNRQFETI